MGCNSQIWWNGLCLRKQKKKKHKLVCVFCVWLLCVYHHYRRITNPLESSEPDSQSCGGSSKLTLQKRPSQHSLFRSGSGSRLQGHFNPRHSLYLLHVHSLALHSRLHPNHPERSDFGSWQNCPHADFGHFVIAVVFSPCLNHLQGLGDGNFWPIFNWIFYSQTLGKITSTSQPVNQSTRQPFSAMKSCQSCGFPPTLSPVAPPIHPSVFFFLSQLSAVWPARLIQISGRSATPKVWKSIGLVPFSTSNNKKETTSCNTLVSTWNHLNHPQV